MRPLTNFTSSRAFSSEIPTFRLIVCREAPFAAGWTGPKCSALSETWRLTAFSFRTSTAALSRSSVEERTSISWSSWLRLVPVSLKSNRCAISRRAWSTAFATSGIETSETMSNEKSCLAMRQSYRGGAEAADCYPSADGRMPERPKGAVCKIAG